MTGTGWPRFEVSTRDIERHEVRTRTLFQEDASELRGLRLASPQRWLDVNRSGGTFGTQ